MSIRVQALITVILSLLFSTSLPAKELSVKSVVASSTLPESLGINHKPSNAADGRLDSYWAEGEASAGLGDWIDFKFGKSVTLSRMVIYNGDHTSREFNGRNNRIKRIKVKFSSGAPQEFSLEDKMGPQVLRLEKAVKTRSVKFILKDHYAGSTFNNTCLTEVRFYNDLPGEFIRPSAIEASSELKADRDSSYGPAMLLDHLVDTVWCEGKDGAGVGESVTATLPSMTQVKEIQLLNGVAASEDTFKKNNRVTKLRVELDGTVREVEVADKYGEFVSVPLGGAAGSHLRLTILGAASGSSFNDTCVSELRVVPLR